MHGVDDRFSVWHPILYTYINIGLVFWILVSNNNNKKKNTEIVTPLVRFFSLNRTSFSPAFLSLSKRLHLEER